MNLRPFLVLALAFGPALAAPAAAQPGSALAKRYAEVRARSDTLFQHRDAPAIAITFADNPFLIGPVPAGRLVPVGTETSAAFVRPPRLQQIAAALRISGLVQIGGLNHLVINQSARKVGDLIGVPWEGSTVFLRVQEILPGIVTFVLEDETVSVRY